MCIRQTVIVLTVSLVAGCDNSGDSSVNVPTASPSDAARSTSPGGVTVALTAPESDPDRDGRHVGGDDAHSDPDPISRLLSEIRELRISTSRGNGDHPNRTIVLKATEILKLTMHDSTRQSQFLDAIRHLLQARLQLALTGSATDIDQLYADVQALNQRDPNSAPAAEGIFCLAKFAHTMARQVRQDKAEWNVNFSRWAREFSSRFPQQSERAMSLLFGASRSCEIASATADSDEQTALLRTEARLCYLLLREKWPKEPRGQEAAAVLRRLDLPGRQLSQFAGPDLSGGRVSAEQFREKITLIYFWDSESHDFAHRWLPLLKTAESTLTSRRIRFVGVNLDEDIDRCRTSVRTLAVPGRQIYFTDEQRRGWNSPLVRFWGVSQSPSVWLIDQDGTVDSVDIRKDALETRIGLLINGSTSSGNADRTRPPRDNT